MYEQHFGLNKPLFPPETTGNDVFVGPQTVETMAGIRKALRSRDAVLAVSGPAGSGKSTLVAKALDALGNSVRVVRIRRIRLKGADVLEYLLEQLGVQNIPGGAIRQFSALRAALAQLEANGAQLVVVVEDALHFGAETMSELEALTAADAGESGGAAIILMGDKRLVELLTETQLARLAQRVRQRHTIKPLSEAEMRGYLLHRFRQAGGDFDASFDKRAAILVHALSAGIPRVANSILEAVMTTAAAAGENPVSATAVAAVAKDEFGLEARLPARAEPAATAPVDHPAKVQEDTPPERSGPQVPESQAAEPVPVSSFDANPETVIEIEPELAGKAEQNAAPAGAEPQAPASQPAPEAKPEAVAESTPEQVPEWEREPTLDELRPDLAALEKAMARAQGDVTELPTLNMPVENADDELEASSEDEIPDITLDHVIEREAARESRDEPAPVEAPPADDPEITAADADRPEPVRRPQESETVEEQLERISAQIAKADTITDIGDTLAERLFGDNVDMFAEQIAAEEARQAEDAAQAQPVEDVTAQPGDALPDQSFATDTATGVPAMPRSKPSGLDTAAYERLKTVRALNANQLAAATQPGDDAKPSTERSETTDGEDGDDKSGDLPGRLRQS